MMDLLFKSPKLQGVFISILADFFTSPDQFPGLGVFALNQETFYDSRIPKKLGETLNMFTCIALGEASANWLRL